MANVTNKSKPETTKAKAPSKPVTKKTKQGTSKESASARKRIFVEAYITNGGNATEAAKTAGYSANTAGVTGCNLLKDPNVSSAIAERSKSLAKKYELTTDLVIKSLVQELTFDPSNLYMAGGQLKDITELDEDTRMALSAVEFEHVGGKDSPVDVRKVKWASRYQAREQAMKHLGMFEKDNEQAKPSVTIVMSQTDADL